MTTTLAITGMTCGGCAAQVERALRQLPGVAAVRMQPDSAIVTHDAAVSRAELVRAVVASGYLATVAP